MKLVIGGVLCLGIVLLLAVVRSEACLPAILGGVLGEHRSEKEVLLLI